MQHQMHNAELQNSLGQKTARNIAKYNKWNHKLDNLIQDKFSRNSSSSKLEFGVTIPIKPKIADRVNTLIQNNSRNNPTIQDQIKINHETTMSFSDIVEHQLTTKHVFSPEKQNKRNKFNPIRTQSTEISRKTTSKSPCSAKRSHRGVSFAEQNHTHNESNSFCHVKSKLPNKPVKQNLHVLNRIEKLEKELNRFN